MMSADEVAGAVMLSSLVKRQAQAHAAMSQQQQQGVHWSNLRSSGRKPQQVHWMHMPRLKVGLGGQKGG